jgi:hypothetical protein
MYSAAIAPLAAAAGVENSELLADPLARRLFFALLRENYRILRQAGVPLARIGPFHPATVNRILHVPGLAWLLAQVFRPGAGPAHGPDHPRRHRDGAYNGYWCAWRPTRAAPPRVLALVGGSPGAHRPHRGVWRAWPPARTPRMNLVTGARVHWSASSAPGGEPSGSRRPGAAWPTCPARIEVVWADIRDRARYPGRHGCQHVYHLAANQPLGPRSAEFDAVNRQGTIRLKRRRGRRRAVLYTSTEYLSRPPS